MRHMSREFELGEKTSPILADLVLKKKKNKADSVDAKLGTVSAQRKKKTLLGIQTESSSTFLQLCLNIFGSASGSCKHGLQFCPQRRQK